MTGTPGDKLRAFILKSSTVAHQFYVRLTPGVHVRLKLPMRLFEELHVMQSERMESAYADLGVRLYYRDSFLEPRNAFSSRDGHQGEERKPSNSFSENFLAVMPVTRSESKTVFAYASIRKFCSSLVQFLSRLRRLARAAANAGRIGAGDGSLSAPRLEVALPSDLLAPVCSAIYRSSSLQ
jgi:hypothetical protein